MLLASLLLPVACLGLVDQKQLPPFMHAPAPPTRPILRLTDFGGKADGVTNNQDAFKRAFAKCDSLRNGCRLELPPTALGVPTVYRTSAINLTSHLDLIIPANVTLRATENDVDNWGAGWPTLQHSSAPSPCAGTPGNCGCGPAKQSWIHAYNVTDISVGGGWYNSWWRALLVVCPVQSRKWPPSLAKSDANLRLRYHPRAAQHHPRDRRSSDLSSAHVAHRRKPQRAAV
eukprot:COSAG05_NODE_254_length_12842_cov_140.995292_2_plen_230_part_00